MIYHFLLTPSPFLPLAVRAGHAGAPCGRRLRSGSYACSTGLSAAAAAAATTTTAAAPTTAVARASVGGRRDDGGRGLELRGDGHRRP